VERRGSAGRGRGGGEGIPSLRTGRVRLGASSAAVALAAVLAAYPFVVAGDLRRPAGVLGGAALAFALLATRGHAGLAGASLFALGAEYAAVETAGHTGRWSVAAYGAGLVVVAELLLWSAGLPRDGLADRRVVADRLLSLAAIAAAALALAGLVLGAGSLRLAAAPAAATLGTLAAVALLALPWLLLGTWRR
jgi:hypothetical protein